MKESVLERLKRAQKAIDENNKGGFDRNENIFLDIKKPGTYRIRFVGEWVQVHSHFIGNGPFTEAKLYPDSAFEGENRLRKFVNCADFDCHSEMPKSKKRCVICQINKTADEIVNDRNVRLDDETIEWLKKVRKTTKAKSRYLFPCIDRDNPEVAPGKKGIKIVEFPIKLFTNLNTLIVKNQDLDFFSYDGEAPELDIDVKGTGKDAIYSVNFVMSGREVKTTVLTDEEKALEVPDLFKIMCKMPSQKALFEKLDNDVKEIIRDFVPEDEDNEDEQPAAQETKKAEEPRKDRFGRTVQKSDDDETANVPF